MSISEKAVSTFPIVDSTVATIREIVNDDVKMYIYLYMCKEYFCHNKTAWTFLLLYLVPIREEEHNEVEAGRTEGKNDVN